METAQTKHRLLLVDGDPKSLRVLDVSLKKAGFDVATATSGHEALALLQASTPDLIISDTDLAEMDGFELCSQIKARPEWAKIPFLFVSGRKSIEDKIRGLELGVEDYLTKPIYIKEIGIRVRTALQRAERERMESRRDGRTRFAGDLSDVGVVDLVQTIELNRKSGIIHIVNSDGRRGSIFFRDGKVIDAEVGRLSGANALYRLFSWSDGQFAVEFKQIRRHEVIETSMAPLLMEGMRRLDESARLLESMPSSSAVLEVDCRVLAEELAELPDEMNSVLRLCDGARSLQEVIEDSDHPDLEALTIINNLYTSHIIFAREAPDRGGESHPGERLARWLSEGGAEDGEASEDATASAEFPAPDDMVPDGEVIPAPTPRPYNFAPSDGIPAVSLDSSSGPMPSTLAPTPDGVPPDALSAQDAGVDSVPQSEPGPVLAPASTLPVDDSLDAILPPRATVSTEASPPTRSSNTLKGVPIDGLFPEQAALAADDAESAAVVSEASDQRSTKPLGLAERLLSEDSALRASAMHEAIAEQEAKVSQPHSNERNTREYGDPAAQAAAIVQEVVSSAHEVPVESPPPPTQPTRPSKEVDWGAWTTKPEDAPTENIVSAPAAPSDPPVSVEQTLPAAPSPPPEAPAPDEHRTVALPTMPPFVWQGEGNQPGAESPAPTSDKAADPGPAGAEAKAVPEAENLTSASPASPAQIARKPGDSSPALPASSSKPSANTLRRTARKPNGARRIWLMFIGAFALGMVGALALSKRSAVSVGVVATPALPEPAASAPALTTIGAPPPVPSPGAAQKPGQATAKAMPPPIAAKPESSSAPAQQAVKQPSPKPSAAPATAAQPVDPKQAQELARACTEADAAGKGKVRAVATACRAALEADPNNPEVMIILARAEIDRGRLIEARNLSRKALSVDPNRLDAYVLLGTAEQEAGRLDEAQTAYKKYLELAPDGPYAKELRAILDSL